MRPYTLAALFALLLGWLPLTGAAEITESHILVATPELSHPLYSKSVLVVKPVAGDQHVGFIINRPTRIRLGQMFPDHAPSQEVTEPVFLGGPVEAQAIFALIELPSSPGADAIEIMPGLFAAVDAATVDKIIESDAKEDARFLAGLVVWRPGELREEIKQGAWHVLDPNPALARRDPTGLWEELVRDSPPTGRPLLRTGLGR